MNAVVEIKKPTGVIAALANQYDMDPSRFGEVLRQTCMPSPRDLGRDGGVTNEELAAFCMVAKEYKLNPLTREIYAFPRKGGGIAAIVPIDGWLKLANNHPQFDGMVFRDNPDEKGNLLSITCKIYRKDRKHPIEVTEYLSECYRGTEPWKKWPHRMLQHKAAIQACRYAFSFSGIQDEDDAARQFDEPARSNLSDRLQDARILDEESHTEGFNPEVVESTIEAQTGPVEHQDTESEANSSQLSDSDTADDGATTTSAETETEVGDSSEAEGDGVSNSAPSALGHIPEPIRSQVIGFAKSYYHGMNDTDRKAVIAEHREIAEQNDDAKLAMNEIVLLINDKDIDGLLVRTGLTEAELKEITI